MFTPPRSTSRAIRERNDGAAYRHYAVARRSSHPRPDPLSVMLSRRDRADAEAHPI